MLVLFETAAGFAVFKVLDENKLKQPENLLAEFQTPSKLNKFLQLHSFRKFADSNEAMLAGIALNDGQICKPLKKILKKAFVDDVQDELLVWDPKLGSSIKEKLGVQVVSSGAVGELMRCIKAHVECLIPGLEEKEISAMSLGLAHNLARYKLKFSPDKVDTMIVQAVSLLDDIDKELNNYAMRAREWYGWHFPELSKILVDNMAYIKSVVAMGTREKACDVDFSSILSEELEEKVKEAAEVSMGTEIAEDDVLNIHNLCQQVIDLTEYRAQLYEYLQNRMQAIAPNLNILVGELVGARLIAHAGSLLNLAKHPASTIQILGAEKALFRALKTRKSTPKYGLIYHAQMIGQSSTQNKGKMSRMLAAKAALAARYDALAEETNIEMGINNMAKLSSRMRAMEAGFNRQISGRGNAMAKFDKYQKSSHNVSQYHQAADSTLPSGGAQKRKIEESLDASHLDSSAIDTPVQKPKKKKMKLEPEAAEPSQDGSFLGEGVKKKKKKKEKIEEPEAEEVAQVEEPVTPSDGGKKKKKKVKVEMVEEPVTPSEKKKKKKKAQAED